ncbi:MAG TPA: ricin-type beta-trefoil lectin domain protein [Trebonia sp.]|jgi:alpha-galactosidase|nr:ricin-type beta-trefoil lectin domain protein [Trebonia sp.]
MRPRSRSTSRWAALATALIVAAGLGLAALTAAPRALAENNGLVTNAPAMGWSSWSFLRYKPTAANIEAQAKALVSSGLHTDGYDYVNLDDFWYDCPGSQGPDVDSNGRWVTNASTFPPSGSTNGIAVVANYVHSLGLKFGIYVTPGISDQAVADKSPIAGTSYTANEIANGDGESNYNCGGMQGIDFSKPGAQAFINSWADEFASWGVDYLKLDGVGPSDTADVQAWSTALNQSGRPILLELSNSLNINDGTTWSSLANSWRTGGDVECYCGSNGSSYPLTDWGNVSARFNAAASWQPYAGNGGWNDYDSTEVGNGSNDGLTAPERQTQLSLWSLASAPLLLGVDLTNLDSGDLALLKNTAVIGVDQDGIPADRVIDSGNEQVFDKRQQNGTWDIGIFNTDTSASHSFSVSLAQLGLTGSATITDLWSGASDGTSTGTFTTTVQPGGVTLISAVPSSGTGGTGELVSSQSGDCLDTTGGHTFFPGTGEEIWGCNGGINQEWSPTSAGELRTMGATECLDAYNNQTTAGTKVQLWPCNGGANQKWTVESNGTIVGQQSGLCLDVTGASTTAGTPMQIWTCNGGANQKWAWAYR